MAAAVGAFLWDFASVPYWVNVVGKCLMIVGMIGAGAYAADNRRVNQHSADIDKLKTDSKPPMKNPLL